jgi:hypothetical protein
MIFSLFIKVNELKYSFSTLSSGNSNDLSLLLISSSKLKKLTAFLHLLYS